MGGGLNSGKDEQVRRKMKKAWAEGTIKMFSSLCAKNLDTVTSKLCAKNLGFVRQKFLLSPHPLRYVLRGIFAGQGGNVPSIHHSWSDFTLMVQYFLLLFLCMISAG